MNFKNINLADNVFNFQIRVRVRVVDVSGPWIFQRIVLSKKAILGLINWKATDNQNIFSFYTSRKKLQLVTDTLKTCCNRRCQTVCSNCCGDDCSDDRTVYSLHVYSDHVSTFNIGTSKLRRRRQSGLL